MTTGTVLFFAMTLCFVSPAQARETKALVLTQTIAFPNVQGGFNHMSVDAEHQRLFAAAPTNQTLEIVDLNSGKPWRSLDGERPAAARYAPGAPATTATSGSATGRATATVTAVVVAVTPAVAVPSVAPVQPSERRCAATPREPVRPRSSA